MISEDVTSDPRFVEWFGTSKATDDCGKPLVVFHGTTNSFERFRVARGVGWFGEGIYFTDDASVAAEFAEDANGGFGANVIPAYLRLENPFVFVPKSSELAGNVELMLELGIDLHTIGTAIKYRSDAAMITHTLRAKGYDGIIAYTTAGNEFVVLDPDQVAFALQRDWVNASTAQLSPAKRSSP